MKNFTVLFDANVLYPNILRDVLIRLARTGIFRARWTDEILDELFHNLQKNRPDLDSQKLLRTRQLICRAVDDCLVTGYENLISTISLPDPNDRHVLAAAIKCGAQIIVSENYRDFPSEILESYGIDLQNSDEFLCDYIRLFETQAHQAVNEAKAAFKNPPRTIESVLDSLASCGAPNAAQLLRK